MGLGNKPNATREITEEEMLSLFKKNYFGTASPDAVQRTLWWFVSINFCFVGGMRRDNWLGETFKLSMIWAVI